MTTARRRLSIVTAFLVISVGAMLIPPVRSAALSGAGAFLTLSDPLERSELLALAREGGSAGELEAADLYGEGLAGEVLLLEPTRSAVALEFARRGVEVPDLTVHRLLQLGIPDADLITLDAGEGGTTAGTLALADFVRRHQIRSVTVVVSPTHGRRYKRALLRVWPADLPTPRIRTGRHDPFHADTWWQSRETLRNGLVELQKLGLDYLAHPW